MLDIPLKLSPTLPMSHLSLPSSCDTQPLSGGGGGLQALSPKGLWDGEGTGVRSGEMGFRCGKPKLEWGEGRVPARRT